VFTNPEPIVKPAKKVEEPVAEIKPTEKKTTTKSSTKKIAIVGEGKSISTVVAANLFAGLFD
jgi:hypothetical protein